MAYPSTRSTFGANPAGTQFLSNPDHAVITGSVNDTVIALEDTVGTTAGTNLMRNAAAGDFAITANAGGTFQQALFKIPVTQGTLGSVVVGTSTFLSGTITGTPALDVNSIPGSALTTSAITLALTSMGTFTTTTATTAGVVAGLVGTVTVPSGGRRLKVSAFTRRLANNAGTKNSYMGIYQGAGTAGTLISQVQNITISAGASSGAYVVSVTTPTTGLGTYSVSLHTDASGTAVLDADATYPAFILCELI